MVKVGLAYNLERDNLNRSKQKMKEYYDRNSKEPVLRLVNVCLGVHAQLQKRAI